MILALFSSNLSFDLFSSKCFLSRTQNTNPTISTLCVWPQKTPVTPTNLFFNDLFHNSVNVFLRKAINIMTYRKKKWFVNGRGPF